LLPPELEEARLLLRKAREDADAVAKLAPDGNTADAIVGFHAQQAVEKALKAILAAFGEDFPWTHDLRYLIERLDEIETPLPSPLREVRVLAPWAVEFRYGETIDDSLDREQAIALSVNAVEWAESQVEASAQAETQRVTAKDIEAGIVRVPRAGKRLFPAERCRVRLVLRGVELEDVRWDPRFGPDQERSGVIGIGTEAAADLAEGDVLSITRIDAVVRLD
jgi:HEPN domain-containing protein